MADSIVTLVTFALFKLEFQYSIVFLESRNGDFSLPIIMSNLCAYSIFPDFLYLHLYSTIYTRYLGNNAICNFSAFLI
jgi:hypothetical protein